MSQKKVIILKRPTAIKKSVLPETKDESVSFEPKKIFKPTVLTKPKIRLVKPTVKPTIVKPASVTETTVTQTVIDPVTKIKTITTTVTKTILSSSQTEKTVQSVPPLSHSYKPADSTVASSSTPQSTADIIHDFIQSLKVSIRGEIEKEVKKANPEHVLNLINTLKKSTAKMKCSSCGITGHNKNNYNCPVKVFYHVFQPPPPVQNSNSFPSFNFPTYFPSPQFQTNPNGNMVRNENNLLTENKNDIDMIKKIEGLLACFEKSHIMELLPDINSLIQNDSIIDIVKRHNIYTTLFMFLRQLTDRYPELASNLYDSISNMYKQAETFSSLNKNHKMTKKDDTEYELVSQIVSDINDTYYRISEQRQSGTQTDNNNYVEVMKGIAFSETNINLARHLLANSMSSAGSNRKKMLRISKELATLATSLPISDGSSVVVRVSNTRIDCLSFMITGPQDTPYSYGCFIFDLYLPPEYPNKPPSCLLRTTGNGSVRFNPNLYNCGKVCLSLLGTWAGPGWDPKESTILQVITSIQALILVDDPYFNEPGYESSRGKPNGIMASNKYNSNIRQQTVLHAMLNHLERITNGVESYDEIFDDVILTHFMMKKKEIMATVTGWGIDNNTVSKLQGFLNNL